MTLTHDDDVVVDVFLEPAPVTLQGFGTGLFVVDASTNDLNGQRTIKYSGSTAIEDAENDETAGHISAATLEAIKTYFGQTNIVPRQDTLIVGKRDDTIATAETYPDALSAIQQVNDEWYLVMISSREDTDIEAVSSEIESSYTKFFIAQTDDAEFLNASPAANSLPDSLSSRERTMVGWHDQDSEWLDMAIAGNRGAFDLDQQSAPWFAQLAGVEDLDTSTLSGGDVANILGNNGNIILPFGPAETYLKPGRNMNGRSVYVILTRDWFKNRLQFDVAKEIVQESNRGVKIPVSREGQDQMAKLVNQRFAQGVEAQHFLPGSTEIRFPAITDGDLNAERIRLEGSARITVAAQDAQFTFEFTRTG